MKKSLDILNLNNTKKITTAISILIILVVYTLIKLPYFDYNFSGEHPMKYNSYVEPAIHMVENKDPFLYQQKYRSNPVEDNLGVRQRLPQFPILEWKLATTYNITPNTPIETSTRIVMHLIGIFTIVFAFLSIKEFTNKTIALLSSLFLATNPIFGLATFVTVYDSFNLMILFMALLPLTLYLKKRQPLYLITIAGILIGLGVAAKVSLLLWALPIVFLLILFKSPNLLTKIYDLGIFAIFLLIPYIATNYAIPEIRTQTILSFSILISALLLSILLTKILQQYKENIIASLEKLNKNKLLVPLCITITTAVAIIASPLFYSQGIVQEFITDTKILFNIDVYVFMAKQFVRHLGIPLAILGILGIVLLPFIKLKDIKIFAFSFLVAGLIFFIIAAKSIFFHDYYTVFLMAVILLHAAIAIYFILEKIKSLPVNILIILLLLLFVIQPRILSTQERFSRQEESLTQAVEYLINNTEENQFYIDEVQATYFSIYANKPRLDDLTILENENFKQDVRNLGFGDTMEKYNIKYLITFNEQPEYERYVNIFSQEDLKRPSYRRSDLILSMVNPEKYRYFEDIDQRDRIIEEYDIQNKFVFEKRIGRFNFFTFEN